jgi:hypothetical protein
MAHHALTPTARGPTNGRILPAIILGGPILEPFCHVTENAVTAKELNGLFQKLTVGIAEM